MYTGMLLLFDYIEVRTTCIYITLSFALITNRQFLGLAGRLRMSEFSIHDLYQIRAFWAHRTEVQFDAIFVSPNEHNPYCVSVLSLTRFVDPAYFLLHV